MGACRLVTDILGEEVEDRLVEACLEEMDPEQIGSVAFEDFLTFFGVRPRPLASARLSVFALTIRRRGAGGAGEQADRREAGEDAHGRGSSEPRDARPARSHSPPTTRGRSPLPCAAAGVPLLRSLDAAARENLARCLHSETRSQGQAIVTKGEQGDAMYFVESGKVRTPRRFRRRPARTR